MLGWAACAAPSAPLASHSFEDSDPFERAARAIDRAQSLVDAYGGAAISTPQLVEQGDTLEVIAAVAVSPGWKTRQGYAARVEGNVDAVWEWARADVRNAFLGMTPQSAVDAHALAQLQNCVVDSMQRAHPDGAPVAPAADDDEGYSATAFAPWLFRRSSNAMPVVIAESSSGLAIPVSASELHPRVLVREGQCFVVEPTLRLRTSTRWVPSGGQAPSEPSEQELYATREAMEQSLFDAGKRLAELRRALGERRGADRRIGELRHLVERDDAVLARLQQRAEQLEHTTGTIERMTIPLDVLVRASDKPPTDAQAPLHATNLCRVHAPSVDLQLRLQIPAVSRDVRVNLMQTDDANQPTEVVACSNAQVIGSDQLVCFVPERTVLGPRTRIQLQRGSEPDASSQAQLGERWSYDAGVECTGLEPAH